MSNSGKIWDIKEAYKQQRNNAWSRGDIGLGSSGTSSNGTINKVQISTTGNAVGFGDVLTAATANGGAMSGSQTRTIFGGGDQPSVSNVICYKEYSSDGNFADFGDLSTGRQILTSAGNATRGIFAGGRTGIGPTVPSNVIDAVSYASLGNATDFGDLTVARIGLSSMQSPTRAVFAGGGSPANVIDTIIFSSAGNATDFGDISNPPSPVDYFGGSSTETRGVFAGGGSPGNTSIIAFLTIASTGSADDFGDLTQSRVLMASAANGTRSVFFGGQQNAPGGPASDVIDYITIATTGNATDFGDVSGASSFASGGTSNGHGGLELGGTQLPSVTYMPGSGRALMVGGESPASPYNSTVIDMLTIPTLGNASDFGDVTVAAGYGLNGSSSLTRGLIGGGYVHPAASNAIRQVELASQGNTADFGDITVARYYLTGASNTTRCVWAGGDTGSISDVIDYKNFASSGNATDFGNLSVTRGGTPGGCSSPTRATFGGGQTSPANSDVIDYITIGSTGNATDFGNLTVARQALTGTSSATRGLFAGGLTPTLQNVIDYITIASTGNATDFGNLTVARHSCVGASNNTRGVFMGGASPSITNVIDYVTIGSTGDAIDFGDLSANHSRTGSAADNHGGLQSS